MAGDANGSGSMTWAIQLGWRVALYAGGCALLALFSSARNFGGVVVAAVALGASGLVLHRFIHGIDRSRLTVKQKLLVLLAIVEAGVVVLAIGRFEAFGMPGFAGFSVAAFGVGQLLAELRGADAINRVAVGVVGANFALALGVYLAGQGGVAPLLIALVLLPLLVSLGTEYTLDRLARERRFRLRDRRAAAYALAVACLGLGAALISPVGGAMFAVVAVVVVVLGVGAVASNTDVDVLLLIVVAAVVWSQFPREGGALPAVATGPAILAFGDSYISGEGATSYFDDTNHRGNEATRNECRRAPTSYPVLVAARLGLGIEDYACSGAVAANITDHGQYQGENPDGLRPDEVTFDDSGNPHKLSQLAKYRHFHPDASHPDVRAVLVSIGGNDVGFGEIVQACLAPGDCSERGQRWLNGLAPLRAKLVAAYRALDAEFPGKVVAVPYPIPIRPVGCGVFQSTLTDREHLFVNGFTRQLDRTVEAAAREAGVHFLAAMEDALAPGPDGQGLRICDQADAADAGINYLALNPIQGRGQSDPTGWVHNSMHPNETGHARMAEVVARYLAGGTVPSAPDADPVAPVTSLPEVLRTAAADAGLPPPTVRDECPPTDASTRPSALCRKSDGTWMSERTLDAVRARGPAVALLLGGAWGVWVGILGAMRRKRSEASA